MSSGTPSVTRIRRATVSKTPTGSPASVATRDLRLSSKSISPFIACAVMDSTSTRDPAASARSSMTSFSMRVESTSRMTRNPVMGQRILRSAAARGVYSGETT